MILYLNPVKLIIIIHIKKNPFFEMDIFLLFIFILVGVGCLYIFFSKIEFKNIDKKLNDSFFSIYYFRFNMCLSCTYITVLKFFFKYTVNVLYNIGGFFL